jgi:hypothetical protein
MIGVQKRPDASFPTAEQHHLLRAALLGDRAAATFSLRAWETSVNIEDTDPATFRLLPLLYENLRLHGIDTVHGPVLRSVYRQMWFRSNIIRNHAVEALRVLREAAIPTGVIKGAAVIATACLNGASRPMADYDVVVQRTDFARAIQALLGAGWRARPPQVTLEAWSAYRHAISFERAVGGEVDLHSSALPYPFHDSAQRDLWQDAVPVTIDGQQTLTMSRAAQILHTCAHGNRFNSGVDPIRWAADAWLLLQDRAGGPFSEWDRLEDLANRLSLRVTLHRSLEYLRDGLDVAVPDETMRRLSGAISLAERGALLVGNSRRRGAPFAYSTTLWLRRALSGPVGDMPRRLRLLPQFVREYLRVPIGRSVAGHVISKAFRA